MEILLQHVVHAKEGIPDFIALPEEDNVSFSHPAQDGATAAKQYLEVANAEVRRITVHLPAKYT